METIAVIPTDFVKMFMSITKLYADMMTDGNILFGENGISMGGMDQSHVSLLRTSLPREMLKQNGGDYTYGGDDINVGITYKVLSKIIGSFANPEKLIFTATPANDTLSLKIQTKSGTSNFSIKLMEIDTDDVDIPDDLEFQVIVDVPFKTIQKAIGQAETLEADSVELVWIPDEDDTGLEKTDDEHTQFRLQYKTDAVNADVLIQTDSVKSLCDSQTSISLSSSYPKRLFAAGQMSSHVRISFSPGMPVLFRCEHGTSDEYGFTEMFVAPRMNDEETQDDSENYRE